MNNPRRLVPFAIAVLLSFTAVANAQEVTLDFTGFEISDRVYTENVAPGVDFQLKTLSTDTRTFPRPASVIVSDGAAFNFAPGNFFLPPPRTGFPRSEAVRSP